MPTEDFYDSFDEEAHELVVFDEFKGQKSLVFLNRWLQGDPFTIRVKGAQILKSKNLPFIFLSNFSPYDCYKVHDASYDAFLTRLNVVHLDSPIEIEKMEFI